MLRSALVPAAPVGVGHERDVVRRRHERREDVGPVHDVGVGGDEALAQVLASAEEREEDVVGLPLAVLDEREVGVALADHVLLVATHEDHVAPREASGGERVEDVVEHGSTEHGHERLGDVVGEVAEAAAAAGADDDGLHGAEW